MSIIRYLRYELWLNQLRVTNEYSTGSANIRFTPESGHLQCTRPGPIATFSLARESRDGGTVRPGVLAAAACAGVSGLLALTSTFGLDFRYFGVTVARLQGR
jgi:hypothetical protein